MDGLSESMFYAAEILGDPELAAGAPVCGITIEVQAERLAAELAELTAEPFTIEVADLYAMTGPDREAALDAVVAGEPSPLVVVAGRLTCAGSLDAHAIAAALAGAAVTGGV